MQLYIVVLKVLPKLINFRIGKFVWTLDITKAFMQVKIHEKDQIYLKYLWQDREGNLKVFQYTSLSFGLVSSPAILMQCLKLVLNLLTEEAKKILAIAIYIDDIIALSDAEPALLEALKLASIKLNSSHINPVLIPQ